MVCSARFPLALRSHVFSGTGNNGNNDKGKQNAFCKFFPASSWLSDLKRRRTWSAKSYGRG